LFLLILLLNIFSTTRRKEAAMIHRYAALGLILVFAACDSERRSSDKHDPAQIMRVDSAMSAFAQQEGFNRALLRYASDDFVKFSEGQLPTLSKNEFSERTSGKPGPTSLRWRPVKGEIAQSGELGYTWGNWIFEAKDTVYQGNYFSVWRRGSNGEWQLALDGGNTTPPQ
jgi:ketosteroid isomerase-like protein